jgi:hypothetical protein
MAVPVGASFFAYASALSRENRKLTITSQQQ